MFFSVFYITASIKTLQTRSYVSLNQSNEKTIWNKALPNVFSAFETKKQGICKETQWHTLETDL